MNDHFIKIVTVLTAEAVLFPCKSQQKESGRPPQPNIILIVSDDMGWRDLGCYGNPIHETPNIDKLAGESVRFTNAYAAAPVSTPTRASMQTGKYPARLHMTVWSEYATGTEPGEIPDRQKLIPGVSFPDLPLEEHTIAELLKSKNYNTIHIGKWHLGESMFYPENQGYDVNIGGGSWGCPANFFYPYTGVFGKSSVRYIPGLSRSGIDDGSYFKDRKGEYLTDRLTDEAIRIMKDAVRTDAPFFLNMCYYAVHTPIEAPDSLVKYYKDKISNSNQKSNATYAAMVHKVDENVGRILKAVHDLGVSNHTIIIFTSDNGGFINKYEGMKVADNSPLRSGKGSLYEGGIRVPLIIKFPGVSPRGAISDTPVITNDFYTTLSEAAGIDTDTLKTDGISILPIIQNPKAESDREYLYWHYPHYYTTTTPVSAIRYKEWKLLKYYEDNSIELYNLKDDMSEKINLAKENPELTEKLLNKLAEWLQETKASSPSPNSGYKK
ncbi:MAG: sulfatase [Porphyromonadaceae bacterium]|nr:sulfatase [Porphyromonadaceae bacterium]